MENQSYSDQINVETFKQLIKMLNNDIKDAKQTDLPQDRKANIVFELNVMRAKLIQNAQENYPLINWINEIEEPRQSPKRDDKLRELFAGLGLN